VLALLTGGRHGHAERPLRAVGVRPVSASFVCDRGPRDLPAFAVEVTGVRQPVVVLDPSVEIWWPANGVWDQSHWGDRAEVEPDGTTVHYWALGGERTEFSVPASASSLPMWSYPRCSASDRSNQARVTVSPQDTRGLPADSPLRWVIVCSSTRAGGRWWSPPRSHNEVSRRGKSALSWPAPDGIRTPNLLIRRGVGAGQSARPALVCPVSPGGGRAAKSRWLGSDWGQLVRRGTDVRWGQGTAGRCARV
jgi:hypothetical protein